MAPPRSPPLGRVHRLRHRLGLRALRAGLPGTCLLSRGERNDAAAYLRADLVVSSGGTYLVEHYALEPRIMDLELALRLGRPLVLFTQSLGPFTVPRTSRCLRRIFERSDLTLLRDRRSRLHVEELGADRANIRLSGDAAFALADDANLRRASMPVPTPARPLRIAISVRCWTHFRAAAPRAGMERFRRSVAGLATHLVRRVGAEVMFLSTCQGVPEYWTDDAEVAREIVAQLAPDVRARVAVDGRFHRPEALITRLADFDLVIATRVHLAILALAAGVPVLPIAYEFKTEELFRRLGLGDWVQDIERATGDSLGAETDRFIRALPALRGNLFARVAAERRSAFESGLHARAAFARRHAGAGTRARDRQRRLAQRAA